MIRKILLFNGDIIISSNYKKNVAVLSALIHVYSQRDFLHKRIIRLYPPYLKKLALFSFIPFALLVFDLYAAESFICHGRRIYGSFAFSSSFAGWQCLLSLKVPNLGVLFTWGCKLVRFRLMCDDHFQSVDINILFAWNIF